MSIRQADEFLEAEREALAYPFDISERGFLFLVVLPGRSPKWKVVDRRRSFRRARHTSHTSLPLHGDSIVDPEIMKCAGATAITWVNADARSRLCTEVFPAMPAILPPTNSASGPRKGLAALAFLAAVPGQR